MKHLRALPSTSQFAILALALSIAACSGCSEDQPPKPPPTPGSQPADPLLTIDGITITFGEIEPALAFFDSLSKTDSRRAKTRRILEEYLIPLRFAEREFAAERALALAQAEALSSVAGNVVELEEHSRNLKSVRRGEVTPRDVKIPVGIFLFDRAKLGAASQPIPVPQGFIVAGAFDIVEHPVVLLDRCDALQVDFPTHDAKTFAPWYEGLPRALADKATFFHPDYRDAMPSWLELP